MGLFEGRMDSESCIFLMISFNPLGHDSHPLHGMGKKWVKNDAERLFHKLVIEDYLKEILHTNQFDMTNAYLKLGPNASKLFESGFQVMACVVIMIFPCLNICMILMKLLCVPPPDETSHEWPWK